MNTKSEASYTVNDIMRKVKKHVFGKNLRQMCDQSPLCRKSIPLVISGAFAVAFPWMCV